MTRGLHALCALLVSACSLVCNAAEELPFARQVGIYKAMNNAAHLSCYLQYQNSLLAARVGRQPADSEDVGVCIDSAKQRDKDMYQRAVAAAPGPAAVEALKTVRVAWIMAMDGIPSGFGEMRVNYDVRQQQLKARLSEAWVRFEMDN